jgi:methylenetetrahydrofolate reductase (NADPH)
MAAPSKLASALASKDFIITCALDPPKGTTLDSLTSRTAALATKVQAVVAGDNPRARLHMAPLGFCKMLLDQGLEPVMTVTCRDRNRLALQADLLAAAGLGIRNILALTGDYITWGDHPQTKPVYDLDSLQLIGLLARFNEGCDLAGAPLEGPAPDFTIGAVASLTGSPLGPQVLKMKKKEQAGVHFFISHPIFDLEGTEAFFKEKPESDVPLLATVCLLREDQIQRYRAGGEPGLYIPERVLEKYGSLTTGELTDRLLADAAGLIESIKKDGRFRGVHLMLQGEEERIGALL